MKDVTSYPSVQQAIASFPPGDAVTLHFPRGTYVIPAGIKLSGRSVVLRGDGQDLTELRFPQGVAVGIEIDNSTPGGNNNVVYISDMSLTTENQAIGTALSIRYQASFDHRWHGRGLLANMEIRGVNSLSGWSRGVSFHEGVNLSIQHVSFLGKHDQANPSMQANTKSLVAVEWYGMYTPCELKIDDCVFTAWQFGIRAFEKTEGIYVSHSTFLFCQKGIDWFVSNPPGGAEIRWRPLLVASDSHFSVYENAIYLGYVVESQIHDNLIYLAKEAVAGGNAIVLIGCGSILVHHNVFHSFQEPPCNGVVLAGGSQYCDVSANFFSSTRPADQPPDWNWDAAIWLQGGCVSNSVLDNSFYDLCRFCEIYDQGSNNVVRNIWPSARVYR